MILWKVLESLETLESSMARFYDALHTHYSKDMEVAAFFARMRDEELCHRDIVRYQRRVIFKTAVSNTDLRDFDWGTLDETVRAVEDLIAREADLTLDDALRSAVAFEAAATERHYRNVLALASPALGKLVQHLGKCDEAHATQLNTFARDHAATGLV